MSSSYAWGVGFTRFDCLVDSSKNKQSQPYDDACVSGNSYGEELDTWFPWPHLGTINTRQEQKEREQLTTSQSEDSHEVCFTRERLQTQCINLDEPPASPSDAYLRLHLLSHRLVEPNTINLEGIFHVLPNIAWTNKGPLSPAALQQARLLTRRSRAQELIVYSIDKFPSMLNYVAPPGVRIADGIRVRLGAYLSPGTTVMHEGFSNFNAGTRGTSMVEGRISQGVVVDTDSDIGGGASTMGTLSGGGKQRVSLGKRCLLGANSGLGIPLGDDCVVEAGLYITAGTKVAIIDENVTAYHQEPQIVAARELAGQSHMLLRRNSITGRIEMLPYRQSIQLNDDLHRN